jgi:glycosyltransferase involved in cell wall biosynthesis
VRPWLESFAKSTLPWRDWVNRRAGSSLWKEWQELKRVKGSWEDTLEEVLSRATSAPAEVRTATPAPRSEFRRGFSIIIPTWNNLDYLKKSVASIRAHSEVDHEIVLHVNDGSDGTLEWVQREGLKHTHTRDNVGICVGMNRAADLCTRDLVMYFNDDMVALPEWDRHLIEYAERHQVGRLLWLSSTLIEPTGDNPSFIAPADYGTDLVRFEERRLLADLPSLRHSKPDMMGTSWAPNLLYREIFDRVGRMSEEFSPGFGSDPDLAKKLWDIGMRHFVGVGRSLVYHFQCKGTGKIPKHLHNDAQGTFYRKHGLSIHDFVFEVLRRQAETPRETSVSTPIECIASETLP